MTDWLGTFLDICQRRGNMLFQPLPAWVWTRDGTAVCWANPAGADILGAGNLDELSSFALPAGNALGRDIANIARRLGQTATLARLRFFRGARSYSLACRCERLVLSDGQAAILIDATEDIKRRAAPDDSAMADYLAFGNYGVAILDSRRRVLANGTVGIDADHLSELEQPGGSGLAEVDIGDARARIRVAGAGSEPQAPILMWIEPLADPAPASFGDGDSNGEDGGAGDSENGGDGNASTEDQAAAAADLSAPDPAVGPDDEAVAGAVTDDTGRYDEPEPDIGQPKIPAEFVGQADGGGEFSRQARMLRAALRKSAETALDYDAQPADILDSLPKKPVRFLWQTDAEDRFLFVSPGLEEMVGRSSQIVGERWNEIADRMRLDPVGRVSQALAGQDTWSGYTAWWPTDDSMARIPAELTALPVFAIDQSFQGYRGFGVLKPAEALSAAAFDRRFPGNPLKRPDDGGKTGEGGDDRDTAGARAANVVPLRDEMSRLPDFARLTPQERSAFDEIAQALRAHDELTQSGGLQREDRFDATPAGRLNDSIPSSDGPDQADDEWGEYSSDPNDPYFLASLPDDDDDYPPDADDICDDDFDALVLSNGEAAEADGTAVQNRAPQTGEPPPAANDDDAAVSATGRPMLFNTASELQSVLDITADGILVLDGSGTVLRLSSIAQAVFGDIDDSLVGRHLGDIFHEDSRQSVLDHLAEVVESGDESVLWAGHEVSVRRGEDIIPLFMKIGPLAAAADDDGDERFGVVIRDISRWKNVEADLIAGRQAAEQASEQKSEFLARVSHEIRTPLNAIIGFAEVMIEERFGPVENERYREYLRDIRTSGEHVVSLVNDLLDISKIEAGKLDLTFAAVPLNDLVRECVTLMQPQANRSKVIVRSSLAGQMPSIIADPRTMRQVVLNLLSNSIKFTGSGGQVIVSTSLSEAGEALLRVRDTGAGMSEADLARALEPFRQLATNRIGDGNGTGLGLPLTKALVESNRATFVIKSARGEGTVVKITFPASRVLAD